MLRVAVLGLGRHALQRIVPAVVASSTSVLYGVCSRDASKVQECAGSHKCLGWTSLHQMLQVPDVDVVYIATPIGLHAEHIRLALAAGKHVWCEKPLTADLRSTTEVLELSRRAGLAVTEGFMYLYHPQFERVLRAMEDGELGQVLSVTSRFGIPTMAEPGFRSDPALGGGALLDVGCYPVSAVLELFPRQGIDVSWATTRSRAGARVDTDGACAIDLGNDVNAWLEWRTDAAYRNEIEVWGTLASIRTDRIFSKPSDLVPEFHLLDAHGVASVEVGTAADHFSLMLDAFSAITADRAAAERERAKIERRAETLDRIRTISR